MSPRIWLVVGIIFGWALIRLLMDRSTRLARSRGLRVIRRQLAGIVADWIIVGIIVYLLFSGGYWQWALALIAAWAAGYIVGLVFLTILYFRRRGSANRKFVN